MRSLGFKGILKNRYKWKISSKANWKIEERNKSEKYRKWPWRRSAGVPLTRSKTSRKCEVRRSDCQVRPCLGPKKTWRWNCQVRPCLGLKKTWRWSCRVRPRLGPKKTKQPQIHQGQSSFGPKVIRSVTWRRRCWNSMRQSTVWEAHGVSSWLEIRRRVFMLGCKRAVTHRCPLCKLNR